MISQEMRGTSVVVQGETAVPGWAGLFASTRSELGKLGLLGDNQAVNMDVKDQDCSRCHMRITAVVELYSVSAMLVACFMRDQDIDIQILQIVVGDVEVSSMTLALAEARMVPVPLRCASIGDGPARSWRRVTAPLFSFRRFRNNPVYAPVVVRFAELLYHRLSH